MKRAEDSAKRLLERLGSAVDEKMFSRGACQGGPDYAMSIACRMESAIEAALARHESGESWTSPNVFKILIPYEEAANLTEASMKDLADEMRAVAGEYINNHRYRTAGALNVELTTDLFVRVVTIQATISASARSVETDSASGTLEIVFQSPGSASFSLKLGVAPIYIGRAAGNQVRLDDPSVSRVHCSVALRSGKQVVLSDLGSANGTSVNGRVVNKGEAAVIGPGDIVTVGSVRLLVAAGRQS